jgi:hypothetical protein
VELLIVAHFAQDILKVGPGIWCFESCTGCCAFDADYLRLHSFYKKCWNEIIGNFLGLDLHHCFWTILYFWLSVAALFFGVLMDFRW